jgi:hypothetical protein
MPMRRIPVREPANVNAHKRISSRARPPLTCAKCRIAAAVTNAAMMIAITCLIRKAVIGSMVNINPVISSQQGVFALSRVGRRRLVVPAQIATTKAESVRGGEVRILTVHGRRRHCRPSSVLKGGGPAQPLTQDAVKTQGMHRAFAFRTMQPQIVEATSTPVLRPGGRISRSLSEPSSHERCRDQL